MSNNIFEFDVAVIGAGPAGMIAAVKAAEKGARVVLVEKNENFGSKLLMTGGGRCNITQAEFDLKKLANEYKNGRFLLPSFKVFGPREFIEYSNKNGVELKVEKNNRVFPVSNKASDIIEMFRSKMLENGVNFFMQAEVRNIIADNNVISKIILKGKKEIIAKSYIVATGGMSYPHSGSTGQGYEWAEKLGHMIIPTEPSLIPIVSSNKKIEDLQGISLTDISVGVYQNTKKIFEKSGELIFTHFGLSGPAVLNISGKVRDLLKKGEVVLKIDLKPHIEVEKLDEIIRKDFDINAGKQIGNCLENLFSEKIRNFIFESSGIDVTKHAGKISRVERRKITFLIKGLEFEVESLFGFEKAMVTSGGVSVREVDSKTMKSKIISNLFFAGEVLDIDGPTGGYNLQMCWSTGYIAGNNASRNL